MSTGTVTSTSTRSTSWVHYVSKRLVWYTEAKARRPREYLDFFEDISLSLKQPTFH